MLSPQWTDHSPLVTTGEIQTKKLTITQRREIPWLTYILCDLTPSCPTLVNKTSLLCCSSKALPIISHARRKDNKRKRKKQNHLHLWGKDRLWNATDTNSKKFLPHEIGIYSSSIVPFFCCVSARDPCILATEFVVDEWPGLVSNWNGRSRKVENLSDFTHPQMMNRPDQSVLTEVAFKKRNFRVIPTLTSIYLFFLRIKTLFACVASAALV